MVRFTGVDYQSLGHYFVGLGLLCAVSSKWQSARACWHKGALVLVGTFSRSDVTDFLCKEWKLTPYVRWWAADQKADTKTKSSTRLWKARSTRSVCDVRIADAALVPGSRSLFNPVFGTGGNIGKRDLQAAWTHAFDLIKEPETATWLDSTLFGTPTELPAFANAGTWFVYNNKSFNSGQSWYREGCLSPWSFLLACEGSLLMRGSSGRRLGARARPYAVFPFVSQPSDPASNDDLRLNKKGEFWAPIWEIPATFGEVQGLFQRGLAKVGGKAATAPHEFAVAALSAGSESGVTEFARFELRQTTSSQVFEALPRETLKMRAPAQIPDLASKLLSPLLGRNWFETLPTEPSGRQSGKFYGLRAPVEERILEIARDPQNPEAWQHLLLLLAETQLKLDRNISTRRSRVRALPLLPKAWLTRCFPELSSELRLAVALASLGAWTDYPSQCNVYGVQARRGRTSFVESGRPARVVWNQGSAESAFLDFVERRLLDSNVEGANNWHLRGVFAPQLSDISLFLVSTDQQDPVISADVMQRWFPALSLINWPTPKETTDSSENDLTAAPPELLLWAFFKPFFSHEDIVLETAPNGTAIRRLRLGASNPLLARRIFHCLRREAWEEAIQVAANGYDQQRLRMIIPHNPVGISARRLAIALALPVSTQALLPLLEQWMEPLKKTASQG